MNNRTLGLNCVTLARMAIQNSKNCREHGLRDKAAQFLREAAYLRARAIHYLKPSL